jgi:hypothetical protein
MDIEKSQEIVRKFNALIERNKDYQAFSDFKEGINRGLEIAKGAFNENAQEFDISYSGEDQYLRIRELQNNFNSLIDEITVSKMPNCSDDRLEGIYTGFERSKQIFKELVKEHL